MIIDSPIFSGSYVATGSLNQIGNVTITGSLTVTGTINASITGSITTASYALSAELLDGLDSTSFTTTSSFNTASGSFSTRVASLENFSSSLDATFATDAQLTALSQSFSSSLSTVSGSLSSRITNNEVTGSNLTTASGSFSTRVTNTEATASNLVLASGSFSTRTTNLELASGSFSTRVTDLETASGSFSTRVTTAENNITNLQNASSSFSTRVTSAENSIVSIQGATGSYATTGSNNFNGNQVITGSLTTTGTIVAQTLNVQQVTSSIVYSSGSNIFGNSVSNTQQFTGSLQVSGSNHYLLGNLGVNTTNPGEKLTVNGGLGFQYNGTQNWHINSNSSNDLLFTRSGIAERMTITSDGGVGIGTTNPGSYKLNVNGESAFQDHVTVNSAKYIYTNNIGANSTSTNLVIAGPSSAHIVLTTSNVGIGTTSPSYKLDVNGTSRFNGRMQGTEIGVTRNGADTIGDGPWYRWTNAAEDRQMLTQLNASNGLTTWAYNGSSWSSIYTLTQGGNVGIGTSSPTSLLHVNGAVSASSFTGATYLGVSYSATVSGSSGSTVAYSDVITTSGPRLYEVIIVANPNAGGSGAYQDFYYGKIIIGTGFSGAAVRDYISYAQESPDPRSLYGSGGGNLTVTAVMLSGGSEVDSVSVGATYTIRIKIAGYNGTYEGQATTIRLKQIM